MSSSTMTEPLKDSPLRKVRCPKCNTLLTEPSPKTPVYQCFNCSKLLQVKQAVLSYNTKGSDKIKGNIADIENIQEHKSVFSEAHVKDQEQVRSGLKEQIKSSNGEASDKGNRFLLPEIWHDDSENLQVAKSFISKTYLPVSQDRIRISTRAEETIQMDGPKPDTVSILQSSPQALPHILQNLSPAESNDNALKEELTFGDVSQPVGQKVISSYILKTDGGSVRKISRSPKSIEMLAQQPQQTLVHSTFTYHHADANSGVNDGEEDGNANSAREDNSGKAFEDTQSTKLLQVNSIPFIVSPIKASDIAVEETKQKLEGVSKAPLHNQQGLRQAQGTQASDSRSESRFGEVANHTFSSNRPQMMDQELEGPNIQVEQKESFSVTGTITCSSNSKDDTQSGKDCSSGKHIGVPPHYNREQSNNTTVHNESHASLLQDGGQNVPVLEMVSCSSVRNDPSMTGWNNFCNLKSTHEQGHANIQSELSNHQGLNRNRSMLASSCQFELTQFDSVPQLDACKTASSVVDNSINNFSTAPNEVNQQKAGLWLFSLEKPDAEKEDTLKALGLQNNSENKGQLTTKLPQLVDSGLTSDSGTHDCEGEHARPLELVQGQRDESAIRQRDFGYMQRRYFLQDDRHVAYINQRQQYDRNAISAQQVSRNGDGVRFDNLVQMKNLPQAFDRRFSDHFVSPVASQQVRHLGLKQELGRSASEKVMVSISPGVAEHSLQSNKVLPQVLSPYPYSSWGSSQSGMMPMPHNHHPLVCCHQPSSHPVCMLCVHQSHLQHHQHLHGALQHPCAMCISQHMYLATAPSHQYFSPCMACHLSPSPFYQPGFALPENGPSMQQMQYQKSSHLKSVEQLQHQQPVHLEPLRRKQRRYPLFSARFAVPYVLCQHCDIFLKVPSLLPLANKHIQKLQCGACGNISKFANFDSNNADAMHFSVVKDGILRDESINNLLQREQVTSSVFHAEFSEPDAVNEHSECDSPCIWDSHGKIFDESFAAWQKSDAHEKNFDSIYSDAHYHRVSRHNDRNMKPFDADSISMSPTRGIDNISLKKFIYPSTIGTQKHGENENVSVSSESSALQEHSVRNQIINNTASGYGHSSDIFNTNGNRSQQHEEYRKPMILGGGAINDPRSTGSSIIHERSRTESRSGDLLALPNESQYKMLHVKENASHFANKAVFGSPLHELFGYSSPSELLDSSDNETLQDISTEIHYQRPSDPMFSKSVSVNYDNMPSMESRAGLQILQGVSFESADLDESFLQKDSPFGTSSSSRSFPWSPSDSPLHRNFPHDLSIDHGRKIVEPTTKGLRQSERDTNKGQRSIKRFLKNRFNELVKSQGNFISYKVMINGHTLSDAVIKRVEKQAGTIHPGSYWYDFRVGFWGVMGGPCLGIIPPFIEDLNFPMPKDCAGGKTGVAVNGRELHEKDLELLARRGLPTIPGKAYTIDIDGRVVDENSGLQLKGLGKLAPTIEKKGQGFGMFQPSSAHSGSS